MGAVGTWIGGDLAIPDPSDAAWPKWVGYGLIAGGAYLIDSLLNENTEDGESSCPDYPGDDPTETPDGYEWKGKPDSKPGDKEGNYHNPETGESLRLDLDHNPPVGPHWDYRDANGNWHRIYPDGSVVPK